jgi:hypothetical protein
VDAIDRFRIQKRFPKRQFDEILEGNNSNEEETEENGSTSGEESETGETPRKKQKTEAPVIARRVFANYKQKLISSKFVSSKV